MIGIIDYNTGNLGSIKNMLDRLGFDNAIISDPAEIDQASKLILPGVGAFDVGMNSLQNGGWIAPLHKKVLKDKIPILGICLGMQLMTLQSEEGTGKGLGWINARTKKFNFADTTLKVPHMGWNLVRIQSPSPLQQELDKLDEIKFYFVHSYFVLPEDSSNTIYSCHYGQDFCAAFQAGNVMGVQFHPEKSHKFGLKLLNNFASL
ncbi:imidazole glycerol phosphate synthase subunit HisH [Niabella soli]|uniref:Imidazole glycerol phosphate synthase subunit HisH n=1 Tax=Niabella soli DSM 19437 TaxID=929713 RepID=W0ETU2_9BACT|nr:imidazole glycerol phosphate synthase subunit HisH [Niabella soli]AHF14215.1 imidazole glycerol phosphate synthase [Niabella soli DSM 19437]